jgi:hypothetical protein
MNMLQTNLILSNIYKLPKYAKLKIIKINPRRKKCLPLNSL